MNGYDTTVLSAAFYGSFAVVVVWEMLAEFRSAKLSPLKRWPGNIAIGLIGFMLERWLLVLTGLAAAMYAAEKNFGLLPLLQLPMWAQILLTVLLMDLLFYLIHRIMHRVPLLWRLHSVHHSDTEFDVTLGLRRHPLELLLNVSIAAPVTVLLGVPVAGLLVFQALRASLLFFEHANVELPDRLDRLLRYVIVTPNMHRVHHSANRIETDSNYTDLLTLWDRLLGSYREAPLEPAREMTIGLEYCRETEDSRLDRMLLQPLRIPSGPDLQPARD